jgi:hypothetical protein
MPKNSHAEHLSDGCHDPLNSHAPVIQGGASVMAADACPQSSALAYRTEKGD